MTKKQRLQKFSESHFPLPIPKVYKDERIRKIKIATGLTEALYEAGFSIESILNNKSSNIAQILGVDDYIGKIIYNETKKLEVKTNLYFFKFNF